MFLLIPVGLFRCSSLGIQGHHYQNLQKLLSVIVLHSTECVCVELCVALSQGLAAISTSHLLASEENGHPACFFTVFLTFALVRMKVKQVSDKLD